MIHYYRYLFVKMKVFNYSELHFPEVTSYKIPTLVQYMKIPRSEHGENMLSTEIAFDILNNFCTQHVLLMFCKNKSF